MLFSVKNLSFNFHNFALKDISFTLKKGEILGIIGESGSGKTLLSLRILGLLENVRTSKGEIIFENRRVESMQKFLGKEITYIPQEPLVALNPLHKIKKQVVEILTLHNPKMPKSALESRFTELMQMVGLDLKFSEVYPYELSGGQRQRVLMAIALANNPKIIIADEPTTALDSVLQKQILDLLRELSRKLEIAVVLITHNIVVVRRYADKILLLKNGEMVGEINSSLGEGNSPLELHSADFGIFGASQTPSLVSSLKTKFPRKFAENHESQTENPSVVDSVLCAESTTELCEAPLNSPASWCKKSEKSEQKCERRFFARSGKSEALPLKAKKRSFLARRGSGEGGAALFAKEISDKEIIESNTDLSADTRKIVDSNESPRNDDIFLDSSPTAQNDKFNANPIQNDYLQELLNATNFIYQNLNLSNEVLLEVRNLSVFHTQKKRLFGKNTIKKTLHNVNFTLKKGEILGIIGESGSGKSTLALALLNLIKYSGDIAFYNQNYKNISNFRAFRKNIQIVFQDPNSSINPRFRIKDIIKEGLNIHFKSESDKDKKVADILRFVGLDLSVLSRFPRELSGGQRQRVAIARALILNPKVLILDEPTSALDKITQKQVLELLLRLKDELGLSYVLITHDLGIISAFCDRIIVLKDGEIVEKGDRRILQTPKSPYTKSLVESIL